MTDNDIKRIVAYKKERLEQLAKPEIWDMYTKNMESGELKEFEQSCIDDEIIIEALEGIEHNKAETKRLERLAEYYAAKDTIAEIEEEIGSEAIKAFVERLTYEIINRPSKTQSTATEYLNGSAQRQNEILDILKEMTEE